MAGICRLVIHRGMEPLQALGLSAAAEAVYLDLLHNREAGRADLEAALCELTELGLVERSEVGVVVRPPRLAMGALAERHTSRPRSPGTAPTSTPSCGRPLPASRTTSRCFRRT